MILVGSQCGTSEFRCKRSLFWGMEPVRLDVNKVCFKEEQDIPNMGQKSRKSLSVTEWCRCGT